MLNNRKLKVELHILKLVNQFRLNLAEGFSIAWKSMRQKFLVSAYFIVTIVHP